MRAYCEFCGPGGGYCCVCGGAKPRFPRLAAATGWAITTAGSILLAAWTLLRIARP